MSELWHGGLGLRRGTEVPFGCRSGPHAVSTSESIKGSIQTFAHATPNSGQTARTSPQPHADKVSPPVTRANDRFDLVRPTRH